MNAILPALVNGAILSALLTAALWLALRLVSRRVLNAATRYAVWWAALAVAVALPVLYLHRPAASFHVPRVSGERPGADTADFAVASPVAGRLRPSLTPIPPPTRVATAELAEAPRAEAPTRLGPAERKPVPTPRSFAWPAFPIEIAAGNWPGWVLGLWLLASAILLIRLTVSWILLQRFCARGFDPPAALRVRAARWLALCGSTRRNVRVACSTELAIPAAVGPLRPAIVIPAQLLGELDENALDQIGLHEAAHLARRDDYALVVQRILEALFVLHPVVRWIARRIDLEREIACDDFVLAVTGQSKSYATCLTRMVELSAGVRPSPAAAAASSNVAKRVDILLDKTRHTGTRLLRARLAVVIAALAALAWIAGKSPSLLAFAAPTGVPAIQGLFPRLALPVMAVHAAAQQPPPPPTIPDELCSVTGKVLNAVTGEPVRKVTVVFQPDGPGEALTTTTGEVGEFAAADLNPGFYNLTATRAGFLMAEYGAKAAGRTGTPLKLSPGQKLTGIELKLWPQGVISGRVLNADGEPVPNQSVSAMKLSYLSGAKSLRAVGSSVTDDLGEYRFAGLEPGTYYIRSRRALPRPSIAEGTAEDRSAKPQQEEYVATYYPGSVSAQGAVPLEVEPAKAVQGIDIKLARSRPTRIGGRVVNQSSQPGPLTVFLYRADDPGDVLGETRANPQGQFAFRGVTRGSYTVVANTAFGRDTRYAELSVEAGADPIENLRLTLTDGFDIPGNVRVEDGGKLDLHTLRINMRPPWIISRVGRLPSESPTSDGNFKFGGVNPDRYIVTIDNLPDGWYLKSAWMGSRDVREGGVDLLRGAAGPLQLVLTGRAGAVTGVVKDEKDARVAGATAALVPQEPARQRQPVFYRSVKTDRSGAFQLKGLPPGEYKLYAWESVENRAWVDAEFLKPVEAKAKAVTIREGDSQIVEIKVIPGRE